MKNIKKTLLAILAVATLTVNFSVAAEASTYRQAKTPLNLRTGASTEKAITTVIPTGVYINELSRLGTWSKVRYGTKTGYASTKYLLTDQQIGGKRIGKTLIVNPNHPLRSSYAPGESTVARAAFEKMRLAAKKEKITLVAFSTYRSYAYQKALFEKYVARDGFEKASTYSAQPGESEHQTGLGFDIGGADASKYAKFSFSSTKEAKWLAVNAHRYGFHLRYPLGKEAWTGYTYESWHFRYVGATLAARLKASGLTMEEYYQLAPGKPMLP
ncbi:D-alanyl-D-alanine carboxypeptidase family protein [Exiguobacterium antarcticum]|uniref:D-alanyl-D-alanine carboxypeptidase family protein n=1 Tax=Exiguobacterium antarcticum TaxID=132920 RepID=A0ABT6R2B8_9BACL|nr:D-alanyl-D-alanine carboxypeptidase family protein [Exiguobacterium antarcticum]AFS69649.1 Peptidase M15B and M15C DD-carboxypeptidase VanY/endolysin [Exiguobacterium antarcticum B7]MDI3234988.1 D-alanyl-D-alanine carboxypeptidase family protein [Exiguobacterium antarcticum]